MLPIPTIGCQLVENGNLEQGKKPFFGFDQLSTDQEQVFACLTDIFSGRNSDAGQVPAYVGFGMLLKDEVQCVGQSPGQRANGSDPAMDG